MHAESVLHSVVNRGREAGLQPADHAPRSWGDAPGYDEAAPLALCHWTVNWRFDSD